MRAMQPGGQQRRQVLGRERQLGLEARYRRLIGPAAQCLSDCCFTLNYQIVQDIEVWVEPAQACLLYTSPSPRD